MEYATLYTVIFATGGVDRVGASKAELAMEGIAPEWKRHETVWGHLYTELHPWAVYLDTLGEEKQIPNTLQDGRKLRRNDLASHLFEREIYGVAFVHPPSDKSADLYTTIIKGRSDNY